MPGGGGRGIGGFKEGAFFGDFGELGSGLAFVAGHGGVIPAEGVYGEQDDVGCVFGDGLDLGGCDGLDVWITRCGTRGAGAGF